MHDDPTPGGVDDPVEPDPTPDPDPTPAEPQEPTSVEPPSVFERLQEQYAQASAERRTTIPIVPGRFSGNLAARYKPVDWEQIRKRIRRAAKGGMTEEDELNYGAAVIAEACETILIRLEDGGPLVPMHKAYSKWRDGEPVCFDERLCEALGVEINPGYNAAAICRLVFKNPAALNDHFADLDAWLKEAVPDDDEGDGDSGERPT